MSRFQKAPAKPAVGKGAPEPAAKKEQGKGEAPVFDVCLPPKQEVVELSGVDFKVKIKGTQPIEVKWTFDGEPLDIDNNVNLEYEVDEDAGEYKLIITEASLDSDSGIYRCIAKNDYGEVFSECDLLLEEMPEHVKQALSEFNKK
ncbi:Muscle M-line assembly protein unc-89 [Holothuria leucospilota]|uniref:Muscle M-line assembly protein unc-89 n=1 Tax=Holothuria leucospilota TaxID=206669 RepID=A0A9Q0YBX7_HOLLE|nr:Muscle M-line assembly protein unc-89 [Holothuria leucospilota]